MRCLEAAKVVTGDAYATLRCAVAYENYVTYGFDIGIGTLNAITHPGERGETGPGKPAATEPNPEEDDRAGKHDASGSLH
jgi:hypothetical protein